VENRHHPGTREATRLHLPDNMVAGLARVDLLTQREREVFLLLSAGLSNNEIAVALSVTTRTAKAHVANVVDKLALGSRLQVCLLACVYTASA
jgi:DNA-binding NarL/FixJ family response regulator